MKVVFFIFLLAQISPIVLFLLFFKKISKRIDLLAIFFYVIVSLVADILLGTLKTKAPIIISAFAVIEYAFFSTFFYLSINSKKFRNFIIVISLFNLIFELILFFLLKTNFDFWAALINTVLIVGFCIFFFYEEMNSTQMSIIYQSYSFWAATGCIIYLSGTLFLFLYTSDLKDKQNSSLWIINVAFEIIKNIFFSIAFILAKNKKIIESQDFDNTNMFEKPF